MMHIYDSLKPKFFKEKALKLYVFNNSWQLKVKFYIYHKTGIYNLKKPLNFWTFL